MFKKLILLALIIFTVSCEKENKPEGYIINGTINASANGKKVKVIKADMQNQKILDSTTVTDGKIYLKGKIDSPDLYIITIDGLSQSLPIVIENSDMNINFVADSLQTSNISGSKENDIFNVFKKISDPIRQQNKVLGLEFMNAQKTGDTLKMKELKERFKKVIAEGNLVMIDKIKEHNDVVTSAAILQNLLTNESIEYIKAEELYNNFTDYVKSTDLGKKLSETITSNKTTAIGSVAPSFSAPSPSGETIALNDIKGKVTIIDFWAAWCGPCRKENPNVVRVYNKYHDKGLEIIGVSLDGSSRQQNPKDAWINAIAKDSLNWHHVSNLNYFNDPVAKLYNIKSIPATFIIDSEGKIVAKDLRGPALEEKIAELLD
jgi:peroxiredoxin